MSDTRKVVIIGSGPAGLTAALYTARAKLNPLVCEGAQPGGQLMITNEVENYPGFPDGVSGPEVMELFRKQAQRFGAETRSQTVTKMDVATHPFRIWSTDELIKTETIIIATGASARRLGLESESRLIGHGVSTCATCDGFFFQDKKVIVVGGGDSAMEEARVLTKFAAEVTIVHRRDQLRASKIMQEHTLNNPKISVRWNTVVEEMLGEPQNGGLSGVILKDTESGKSEEFRCDGVFLAIGHIPNTDLFKGLIEIDERGYIITQGKSTHTSVPGVFACGDVQDSVYRQAVTAAGSGCAAAIDAERFLENRT